MRGVRRRLMIWAAVAVAGLGVAAANAHLVYVALESQPDCVAHAREAGGNGSYRAAKSSC